MNGSIDAVNMYGMINSRKIAKEINTLTQKSGVNLQNIDYRTATILVATSLTPAQIRKIGLQDVIPKRKYKKGSKPGTNTRELITKLKAKAEEYDENNTETPPNPNHESKFETMTK